MLNFDRAHDDAKLTGDELAEETEGIVIDDGKLTETVNIMHPEVRELYADRSLKDRIEAIGGTVPVATADNDVDPFATPEELVAEQEKAGASRAILAPAVSDSGNSTPELSKPDDVKFGTLGPAVPNLTNGSAAAEYAKLGWRVFPIWPMRDGKCACGMACASPGKHPLHLAVPRGLLDASTDLADVMGWWIEHPDANVGLVTGDGLVVLDVDPKNGGDVSIQGLLKSEGRDTPWLTPTVVTGSGGLHFYFHSDKEFRNKTNFRKFAGIDVRGDGGYVVAPPSNHASGKNYEWADGTKDMDRVPWPWPEEEKVVRAEPVDDQIPEGQRNARLTSLAGSDRRRGLTEEEIYERLIPVNEKRCVPPLADSELRSIARSVATRYEPADSISKPSEEGTQTSDTSTAVMQLAHRSDDFLDLDIKPPTWLVETVWPEKAIGYVSGPAKSFKSFFVLELAFAIATGKKFLDRYVVPRAAKVLTIQAESDLSSFKDRVRRAKDHYGDAPLLYVISNKPLYLDNDVDLDRLRYEIRAIEPELVILDPMASFHRGDENNTQQMQAFIRAVRGIRDEFNTGVLIVHHWTKTPPGERILRGGERMRGNSGLHGSSEASVFIRRVSDDLNRSVVKVELKESEGPKPFTVQFDPATSALQIVTDSGIMFGHNPPSAVPYYAKDAD